MPIIYDEPDLFGASPTLDDLIEEVLLNLHGYTTKGDQLTFLTAEMAADALTFRVDGISEVSRGVVEVGNELMRVQSVDRSSGTVTVLPRGRGWRGTAAASHHVGDTVLMSPLVPRVTVGNAINDTIMGLYPDLYPVATDEFVFNSQIAYSWALPADAESILAVRYRDILGNWQRVRRWELETSMSTADFPTGKAVRIIDVPLGQTVQVVYATIPKALRHLEASFTDSGLPNSWRDLVVLGSQARLVPSLDTARLSVKTVAADELDSPIQVGTAVNIARDMMARFTARVAQERAILQRRYPAPVHYVR